MKHLLLTVILGAWPLAASAGIEVQGHRGARALRPENTLPAFDYAVNLGVDTLELDLAVSQDGVLMISHDPFINPAHCFGAKGEAVSEGVMIHTMSAAEVQKYDCGGKKNPAFPRQVPVAHTPIPKFADFLAWLGQMPLAKNVQLNVETKIFPGHPERSVGPEEFAKLVVQALTGAKMIKRTTLESFDDRTLLAAKKLAPELRTVLLTSDNHIDYVAAAKAAKVYAISPDQEWILPEDVKALHKAGIKVIPWTVNEPAGWQRMVDMGVDGVISDDPAALIEFLRAHKLRN